MRQLHVSFCCHHPDRYMKCAARTLPAQSLGCGELKAWLFEALQMHCERVFLTFSPGCWTVCRIPVIQEQLKAPRDSVKLVGVEKHNRRYTGGNALNSAFKTRASLKDGQSREKVIVACQLVSESTATLAVYKYHSVAKHIPNTWKHRAFDNEEFQSYVARSSTFALVVATGSCPFCCCCLHAPSSALPSLNSTLNTCTSTFNRALTSTQVRTFLSL